MKILAKLVWKLQFAYALRKITHCTWSLGWSSAGAWLEMLDDDLSEDPKGCAEEEVEEWRASL